MKAVVAVCALFMLASCDPNTGAPELPKTLALSPEGVRHTSVSYSLDGKRIAYWAPSDSMAGAQLWVANSDMSGPAKLPATSQIGGQVVAWSPDGARIASLSGQFGIGDIVVIPSAGGEAKRLTDGEGFELPLTWNRDGDRLSYFRSAEGGTITSATLSVGTGISRPLVPSEKRPYLGVLSPDGSHVAYFVIEGAKTTIWVADSIGGNPRQLTTEGFESLEQYHEWSPDGKELLYQSRRTGTADLWVVPIDGGKPRQLTRDVRNDVAGVWSPDGHLVAFISDRGRQTDVWVVPAAGGEEQRITDNVDEEQGPLAWQPGSQTVAYIKQTERSGTWAMNLADGKERRLTPDSIRANWFNVSPNGREVNYVIPRGGGIEDLAVVPIDGGMPRMLVTGGGIVRLARWSPDGSKIAFMSDRGGSNDIWVIDAAGGAPRQLMNSPGFEDSPIWSADGSSVLFTSDRDSRLGDIWKASVSGGEPVRVTTNGAVNWVFNHPRFADDIYAIVLNARGGFVLSRLGTNSILQPVVDRVAFGGISVGPFRDSLIAQVEQADGKERSMMLATNGSGGRPILKQGEVAGAWSNDGKWLVFHVTVGGASDIGILNIRDGTSRRLTTTPFHEDGTEFTPDGKTIVFRRAQTVQRIFTVDISKLLTGGE